MSHFKYLIIGAFFLSIFSGCGKFLDINAQGNTNEDEIFKDLSGFKDALYGVYATLAQTPLYGENMSYGFIDDLAQLYYLPANTPGEAELKLIHQYAYTDSQIESYSEGLWRSYYKTISYVNNILRHIERISNKPDYPLIKGEVLGLRAFLHFEVLRLYAENIQISPNARGIPYAYTFNLENKTIYSLKDSYSNILKDLNEAEKLLKDDDKKAVNANYFNKYAVFALKARVFLWMKDYDNALTYAKKVIEYKELHLSKRENIGKAKKYPGNNEMIWGLFSEKLYTPIFDRFLKYTPGDTKNKRRLIRRDVKEIYEQQLFTGSSLDARYSNFILPSDGEFLFIRLLERRVETTEESKAVQGICMLRLPEMYYIAAEASFDKKPIEALKYYNAVRTSRGLREIEAKEAPTRNIFDNLLLKERIKEFWGEGQIFFDYKRLNVKFTTTDKKIVNPSKKIFVLPWPRNERDFGEQYNEK